MTRLEKAAEENSNAVSEVKSEGLHQGFVLNPEKQDVDAIISKIEELLLSDDDEDDCSPLEPLDDCAKIAIVSHSIMAYVSTLDRHRLSKLNARLTAETTRWLSYMFR